jgi:methylmalonyl-CoA/ethylmalonyl-CoA epimerase
MAEDSTGTADFGLSEIGQIAIIVHDLAAATAFYRDQLGMRLLFEAPNMSFFQCGSVRLMLGVPESPEFDHPSSIIYYRVADIDDAFRTLKGRGVSFLGEPHRVHRTAQSELWMAFFKDLDQNVLCLMQERPAGPAVATNPQN